MDRETVDTGDAPDNNAALLEGYRQMGADEEREKEAGEWTEHILFDLE
jgi:hypothetical protein